jgi:hypothetical protein
MILVDHFTFSRDITRQRKKNVIVMSDFDQLNNTALEGNIRSEQANQV